MVVERNKAVFTEAPTAVPDGNVDVSGGGRWKIWQNAGTKIDAPILGNGDLLAAVAGAAGRARLASSRRLDQIKPAAGPARPKIPV